MNIIIEGKAGHRDIVIFGKNFGWLRAATTVKGRRTGFRTVLGSGNAYADRIAIPGPVDAILRASVSEAGAYLVIEVIMDDSQTVVWEFNRQIPADRPLPFRFRVGTFEVEGTVRVE